jgi:hypothetical protein
MDTVRLSSNHRGSPASLPLKLTSGQSATAKTRLDFHLVLAISRSAAVQLLVGVSLLILPCSAQQILSGASGVRSCKSLDSRTSAGKKSTKQKKKNAGVEETGSGAGCLEVHSTTLDVQEHLQAFVREQKWRVGDEEIGETFLSFSVALSKEELLGYTTPDTTAKRVEWRSGKAVVLVKTSDLSDGYTRTIVSAHFEGFGDPDDSFAMKRASWTLNSSGRLEATLTSALQLHYRSDH